MRFTYLPIVFIVLFVGYVLYLALVKKNLKANMRSVVLPGLFFIAIWALIYFIAKG
jgi:hypothetical protein